MQTSHNDAARVASDRVELVALLCAECHQIAPRRAIEKALWENQFRLFGKEKVLAAIEAVRVHAPNIHVEVLRDGEKEANNRKDSKPS